MLYLASHGRLGYDLLCQEVFEASPKALWSWLLIIGTLLGYWIVLCCMVYVAKRAPQLENLRKGRVERVAEGGRKP